MLWVTFTKEALYIECDRLTREKGRLVKMTALHDLRSFSVMKFRDKRFMNAFGEVRLVCYIYSVEVKVLKLKC